MHAARGMYILSGNNSSQIKVAEESPHLLLNRCYSALHGGNLCQTQSPELNPTKPKASTDHPKFYTGRKYVNKSIKDI